mmetsp:Transcript_39467/g.68396  ORF Transcript_39467/g.68396 Transcript_39467/m.68396 type:complete len:288 (-) Transcript_39467:106-969(-)|eukprot:CAMPEP_0184981382 /NCGR_PEP_ID=MMETSP1098-20130426/11126_1 /TAXON_ID=89044 /ORGANISM="Spumella elongata, Strain CCAP 955/1" /LENGTH=287 /DNA_ID=CAMNT_0027504941 /DNA_START=63 /DNA_END=926 /DNA_ORIENTATION=-
MSDFENEEEISVEEKLQITQHYLLSSPPGQFHEVLSDIRKIIPAEILPDSLAGGIARVSNLKNSKVVTSPSGKKVVLAQAGEIDPTHYFNAQDGSVFSVDHLTLSTSEAATLPSNEFEANEPTRAALQTAVNTYIATNYPSEQSAGGAFTKDEHTYVVVVTGEKTSLKNFWSGRWTSTWNLVVSGSSATISGDIKLHVHYFEDGNLQLQSAKQVPASDLTFSSDAELGANVVKFIQTQESLLQSGLEDLYSNMSQETFRSMRRLMPITRTKMEWNVNAVRMVKQVRK